ncbi:MAG: DNA-directed polymerase subunit [Candidatus Diapherotrites archaeon]|nr:DNA-directed polymerase subunit [Candidatus Diapherotrites archaeon]MDN5366779.1 DNA-directed polymerase subunit [Candidatus Diapherotrites archaeon]
MSEAKVYINGRLVGFHKEPKKLVEAIRAKRRNGQIPYTVSVTYYETTNEVYVYTDAGRVARPVIVVKDGKPLLTEEHIKALEEGRITWRDLVRQGIVEYLDAEEEENAYIAPDYDSVTKEHTHVEIHPIIILGFGVSMLPWAERNLSSRNLHGAKMLDQGLGLYAANFRLRTDTMSYVLYYPQKPIVKSRVSDYINYDRRPSGQNIVVALTPDLYAMDDALVMNLDSVQRGLFRAVFFRTYVGVERRYPGGQRDRFELPTPEVSGYLGEEYYHAIGEDGLPIPETYVKGGDVLIGRTSPPRFLEEVTQFGIIEEHRNESSITVRMDEEGYVDTVLITDDPNGSRMVKVKLRQEKIPELGDKFAARGGQKGVIGMLVPHEDMPYTENGIVPDLIFNTHSFLSRMTVSYLLEILGAKAGALKGEHIDATPWHEQPVEYFEKVLREHGFRPTGKEILYDGVTGEEMKARIYMGPMYYQRLKHLASQKIQARARGPVQILTRQPTEGKAREGGIRFGEMERDTLIGHGAAMTLYERLVEESDKTTILICEQCGNVAVDDAIRKERYCPVCGSRRVHEVEVSYAFKLLLDELKALGIYPKIVLRDKA